MILKYIHGFSPVLSSRDKEIVLQEIKPMLKRNDIVGVRKMLLSDERFTGTRDIIDWLAYHLGDAYFNGSNAIYSQEFECAQLESVSLPNYIDIIGNYAFDTCSELKQVIMPDNVKFFGGDVFSGCGSLKSVVLPKNLQSIPGYTFYGCSSLEKIAIPDSVSSIGARAFAGCARLRSVTVPRNCDIDDTAFSEHTEMVQV